jgi:hypothetical protein
MASISGFGQRPYVNAPLLPLLFNYHYDGMLSVPGTKESGAARIGAADAGPYLRLFSFLRILLFVR